MEFSNENRRCLVCSTEIIIPEHLKSCPTESSEGFFEPDQKFDKIPSLLSILWVCLGADSQSRNEYSSVQNDVTELSENICENSIVNFCNSCENYLSEFDQLSKQISMLHRRVITVKFTIIAKVLATKEDASEIRAAAADFDDSSLWTHSKLSHFRSVLKREFNPNVRLKKLPGNLATKSSSPQQHCNEESTIAPFFELPDDGCQDVDQESCHDSVQHDDDDDNDQDYEPITNSGDDHNDDDDDDAIPAAAAPSETMKPKRSHPGRRGFCKEISPNEFIYAEKYKFSFDGTKYSCLECSSSSWTSVLSSTTCKSKESMLRHIRSCHFLAGEKSGQAQSETENIQHHEFKGIPFTYDVTANRYCCSICPSNLKERASIRSHIKLIHLGQPGHFICEVCGDSFQNEPYLKKHHRQVHGEPRHKCPHCDKLFRNRKNFNAHVTLHELGPEEARKFVCEYCGKKFHRRRYLVKHVRIHTGEKPLSCDLCDEKFADTGKRSYHKRTVHRVFSKKAVPDVE